MSNDNNNHNQDHETKDFVDMRGDAPGQTPPDRMAAPRLPDEAPHKRRRKWPIITLIVLGVLVLASMFNISGGGTISGSMTAGTPVYDESFAAAAVRSIDVWLATGRLEVREHSGNDVRVVFTSNGNNYHRPVYAIDAATGELRVGLLNRNFNWSINFGLPQFRSSVLTVYLPQGMTLDAVSLTTTTGRIEASDVHARGEMQIRATTGRITAERISSAGLSVTSTTGRINITDATAGGDAFIHATTGGVRIESVSANNLSATVTTGSAILEGIVLNGALDVRTTTGRQNVSDVQAQGHVTQTSTTGRVTAEDITAGLGITIRTTTGSVRLNTANAHYVQTTSTTGRNTIVNANTAGDATVRTTTGSISISGSRIDGALSASATTGRISLSNVDTDMSRANLNNNRNARISVN